MMGMVDWWRYPAYGRPKMLVRWKLLLSAQPWRRSPERAIWAPMDTVRTTIGRILNGNRCQPTEADFLSQRIDDLTMAREA